METKNLLEEAREVNSSLSRVHQTLSWTVHQSEASAQVLNQDGTIIQDTLDEHKHKLRSALETTKKRLDRIQSLEKYERIATMASTIFFTIVVCYILLTRFGVFYFLYHFIGCRFFSSSVNNNNNEEEL
eukprot:gene377-410_t